MLHIFILCWEGLTDIFGNRNTGDKTIEDKYGLGTDQIVNLIFFN